MTGEKKLFVLSFLKVIINVVFIFLVIKFAGSFLQFAVAMVDPDCGPLPISTSSTFGLEPDSEAIPYTIKSSDPDYEIMLDLWGHVEMHAKNRLYILIVAIPVLFRLFMHVYMVFLLRKFFDTTGDKGPFIRDNALRLRWIGWIIIGAEILRIFTEYAAMFHMKGKVILQGAELIPLSPLLYFSELRVEIIFVGVVLLLIAEIFRLGAQMKEEQDLTV